jgi:hypothetical protein
VFGNFATPNIWHATIVPYTQTFALVFLASVLLLSTILAFHITTPHVIDSNLCQTLPEVW